MGLILLVTIGALLIAAGLIICGFYLFLQKEREKKSTGKAMAIGGISLAIFFHCFKIHKILRINEKSAFFAGM